MSLVDTVFFKSVAETSEPDILSDRSFNDRSASKMSMFDVDDDDIRLAEGEVQALSESTLSPKDVEIMTDNLMAEWGIHDAALRNKVLVRLLTYLIENAPSPRGDFNKVIEVDGKQFELVAVKKHMGRDVRRWFRDSRIVALCFRIMKRNAALSAKMASHWEVYDQRLFPFCFETSLLLPHHFLGIEDRNLLAAKRVNSISKASPFVRADLDRAGVDNSRHFTGTSDRGESMVVRPRDALMSGLTYD